MPFGCNGARGSDGKQMYDKYYRMNAVVYCNGTLLNVKLLFADHALIMRGLCEVGEFGDEDWANSF